MMTQSDNRGNIWPHGYDPLLLYVAQESLIATDELPSVIPMKQYDVAPYTEPIHFVVGEIMDRYQPILMLPLQ